jgi:hypothetical protein
VILSGRKLAALLGRQVSYDGRHGPAVAHDKQGERRRLALTGGGSGSRHGTTLNQEVREEGLDPGE